jgi:hypothetical protein
MVMMFGNRALAGRATGGTIGGPRGSRKRGVQQNDDEQTDGCENRTTAMLIAVGHILCDDH